MSCGNVTAVRRCVRVVAKLHSRWKFCPLSGVRQCLTPTCFHGFILHHPARGEAVYFFVSWYPLPPDLLESWDYGQTTTKIFELEGLICKIFRTKELTGLYIIYRLSVQLHD
jgi:hypothetical protein